MRFNIRSVLAWGVGSLLLVLTLLPQTAFGQAPPAPPAPVPEIDPGSAAAALTVLGGTVFIFFGRRSKKPECDS